MLRSIHRVFTNSHIHQTLRMVNLKPGKEEDAAPALPSTKKKVKIPISSLPDCTEESTPSTLNRFFTLPHSKHELPVALQERESQMNEVSNMFKQRVEDYENYIKAMREMPTEGKHFIIKSRIGQPGNIESREIRSYILTTLRANRTEGVSLISELPKNIMNETDESQLKYYPGLKIGDKIEYDEDHWANWYLKNQPKDIQQIAESDWEPIEVDRERTDEFLQKISKSESFEGLNDNEDGEAAKEEPNDHPQGKQNVNLDAATDLKRTNSFQTFANEEFLERKHNILDEIRNLPIQDFLQNPEFVSTTFQSSLEDPDMLPPVPPSTPMDLMGLNNEIESWCVFRNIPYFYRYLKTLDGMDERFKTDAPWVPVKLPSLLNYYEMLPNFFKNHRLVQGFTLCMERFHPKMPRKQKELMLNRLCNLLAPRDPEKYLFLQEYFDVKVESDSSDDEFGEKEVEEINSDDLDALEKQEYEEVLSDSGSEGSSEEENIRKQMELRKLQRKTKKHVVKKHSNSDESEEEEEDAYKIRAEAKKAREEKKQKGEKKAKARARGNEEDSDFDEDEDENENEDDENLEDENSSVENSYFDSDEQEFDDNPKLLLTGKRELNPEEQLQKMLGAGEKSDEDSENEEDEEENVEHFEIPDYEIDWFTRNHENPDGLLPSSITFYDNKDGYWDDWIKVKRERAGIPEISVRTYLKH